MIHAKRRSGYFGCDYSSGTVSTLAWFGAGSSDFNRGRLGFGCFLFLCICHRQVPYGKKFHPMFKRGERGLCFQIMKHKKPSYRPASAASKGQRRVAKPNVVPSPSLRASQVSLRCLSPQRTNVASFRSNTSRALEALSHVEALLVPRADSINHGAASSRDLLVEVVARRLIGNGMATLQALCQPRL